MNYLQQLTVEMALLPTLAFVFLGGLLSGLSPCTMPTALLVVGYVGGHAENRNRSFQISLAFISGISITLAVLGLFAALAGRLFLNTRGFTIAASFIVIAMGLSLLGIFRFNYSVPVFRPLRRGSLLSAFLLGIPFGLAASPCTVPLTITVLAFVATRGNPVFGFVMLFVFALGRSIPLLAVGTFSGLLQHMQGISVMSGRIEKVSGTMLILLGLYLLW